MTLQLSDTRSGVPCGTFPRVYGALGDAVVVLHFAFVIFLGVGGLLAVRWRWVVWTHVPAVAWGVGIVTVGYPCPLTTLEKALRERAGGVAYDGGFIDRYVEGVVYPGAYTPHLRLLAVVLVVGAYAYMLRARRRPAGADFAH
jgi:hypothetical protein